MASEAVIESRLKSLGVSKSMWPELVDAFKQDGRAIRAGVRARLEGNRRSMSKLAASSLAVTAGGAVAEPIRREVVGRLTKGVRGQALGLLAAGVAVDAVVGAWAGIPFAREIGDAHKAYAGVLLSISLYGDDKNKDAMVLALEGTTRKAKKDKKKPAEEE